MTPDEYRRKFMCNSIAADLRAAALQADDWGHELREAAFEAWRRREGITANEVPLHIELIGMRKESRP